MVTTCPSREHVAFAMKNHVFRSPGGIYRIGESISQQIALFHSRKSLGQIREEIATLPLHSEVNVNGTLYVRVA